MNKWEEASKSINAVKLQHLSNVLVPMIGAMSKASTATFYLDDPFGSSVGRINGSCYAALSGVYHRLRASLKEL